MKEKQRQIKEAHIGKADHEVYHLVYTEKHGPLLVRFPPDLSKGEIIRVTVGELPGGELIVNLYTEDDFGYAYNVTCPRFSEWGYLPS
jgi:hypothetical protein